MARTTASASAKAGTKRAASSAARGKAKAQKAEPESLVEQIELQSGDLPKETPAKKRLRTEDAAIQKVLHDNFAGFSEEEMFINEVHGRSLAQQIRYDRQRSHAGEKVVMGKGYYLELRKLYQSQQSVSVLLSGPNAYPRAPGIQELAELEESHPSINLRSEFVRACVPWRSDVVADNCQVLLRQFLRRQGLLI